MDRKEFVLEVVRNWNTVCTFYSYGSADCKSAEFVKGDYRCWIKESKYYDNCNNSVYIYVISIGKLDDNTHNLIEFVINFSDFTDTELSEIKFLLSLKSNNAIDNAINDAINK